PFEKCPFKDICMLPDIVKRAGGNHGPSCLHSKGSQVSLIQLVKDKSAIEHASFRRMFFNDFSDSLSVCVVYRVSFKGPVLHYHCRHYWGEKKDREGNCPGCR